MTIGRVIAVACCGLALWLAPVAATQPSSLAAAIDRLGAFDYPARAAAARTVRRAPAAEAVPLLAVAVRTHADSYVRFKALVLAAGFGGPAVDPLMRDAVVMPNVRVRTAAYAWFERHPSGALLPTLITALAAEDNEFARPALTRALAVSASDPAVRAALAPLILSGEDYFRGETIAALGEAKAAWAREAILGVAVLDGPLQDDAVLAAGRIGGPGVAETLARLQRAVSRERQSAIAAAYVTLGVDASAQRAFLADTLAYAADAAGQSFLLRATARALGALAGDGDAVAFDTIMTAGSRASDESVRAPLALALGGAAVRQPQALLAALGRRADPAPAIALLAEAFEMLEEDFAEELFYAAIRTAYWAAPDGSPARRLAGAVIDRMEF